MKHIVRIVVLLALVATPAVAFAQVSGGFRVGVNLSSLSVDPDPPLDFRNLTGLAAGAFVTLPVNDLFAIQPEALYSRQGVKVSDSGVTAKTMIDYVQIPVLARVRTSRTSPLAMFAGPSFGIRTHAGFSMKGLPPELDVSDELDEEIKRFDFGLATGAVLDVGHVVLDGRYTWGLTNIAKTADNPSDQDTVRNRVLSFSVGLRF